MIIMTENEQLSEIEQIRLKSIDPDFLRECDIAVKRNREIRREKEYAVLLEQRVADEMICRDVARKRMEKELK
jgi:hypothetical protein